MAFAYLGCEVDPITIHTTVAFPKIEAISHYGICIVVCRSVEQQLLVEWVPQ